MGELWSFDINPQLWATEKPGGSATGVAGGTYTMNPFTNEAYYIGGMQDSWLLSGAPDLYFDGMMVLNMTNLSWRNETVPGPSVFSGFLEWLPIGAKGALVAFGGWNYDEGVLSPTAIPVLTTITPILALTV